MPDQDRDRPPDATRFFARIRSVDLECPACGRIFRATGNGGPFDRRTGLFRCPYADCGLVLYLGVIAYPATSSRTQDRTAPDWIPTPRQAAELRLHSGFWAKHKQPPQAPRNVLLRAGCRCQLQGTGLLVHPSCPVHGSGRMGGGESREGESRGK